MNDINLSGFEFLVGLNNLSKILSGKTGISDASYHTKQA